MVVCCRHRRHNSKQHTCWCGSLVYLWLVGQVHLATHGLLCRSMVLAGPLVVCLLLVGGLVGWFVSMDGCGDRQSVLGMLSLSLSTVRPLTMCMLNYSSFDHACDHTRAVAGQGGCNKCAMHMRAVHAMCLTQGPVVLLPGSMPVTPWVHLHRDLWRALALAAQRHSPYPHLHNVQSSLM
jgi:hypothetical protein